MPERIAIVAAAVVMLAIGFLIHSRKGGAPDGFGIGSQLMAAAVCLIALVAWANWRVFDASMKRPNVTAPFPTVIRQAPNLVAYDHLDKPVRVGQEVNLHDTSFGCTDPAPVVEAWRAFRNSNDAPRIAITSKPGCFGGANLQVKWVIRAIEPPLVQVEFLATDPRFPEETTIHPPRHDVQYWVPDYLVAGH